MAKYKTYYGRKKLRWLKILLTLLIVGGLVSLCVFVLPDYVTFSEDGIVIDLPFLREAFRKPVPSPEPSPPDNQIIIEVPSPAHSPSSEPSPSPEPSPKKAAPVRALFVPMSLLGDGAALEALGDKALEDGINELVFEYKDKSGAVADAAVLTQALAALSDPSITLTAMIPACIDSNTAYGVSKFEWTIKIDGINFKDSNDNRWLNLYKPEVRDYISELTGMAYQLGFNRVLLTDIGFPYSSGSSRIDYNGEDTAVGPVAAVNALLTELRGTYPSLPLDAWIYERTASEGLFEVAGQSLESFSDTFDRLYVLMPDDVDTIEERFIPILITGGGNAEKTENSAQGFMLYSETGTYFEE